ncbi:methyl-accepting chemotaxis protein, partial [Klebsiella pneumoniae]|nr:methyl-accepting chemotaxis protein [Klebsiella pneumoniae]
TPDLSSAQQALDNMGKKLAEMKAISPGPMDEQVSAQVIGAWQALLEQGVTPQMEQAKQATLDGYRQQANNVTPPLSRAFGAAAEKFNNAAAKTLDSTRMVV